MVQRILIADNDALMRSVLSERLAEHGFEVRLAADGLEAWQQIQVAPPDVLILDLIMPRLDGARLCRYVKTDPRFEAVRVFVLTATAAEAAAGLSELGADAILAKRAAREMLDELLQAIRAGAGPGESGGTLVGQSLAGMQPRQIVHELLAETAHLTSILQHLGEGVVLLDPSGRILLVNPAGETLLGGAERELVGRELVEVLGQPAGRWLVRALTELTEAGSGRTAQVQIMHGERTLLVTVTGLREERRAATYLLLLRDVSSFVRRIAELTTLNELAAIFTSTLEPDALLQRVMERVQGAMQVEAGALLLTDPATGELVFRVAVGEHRAQVEGLRLAPGQGIAGWVCREGLPVIVPDAQLDSRFFPGVDHLTGFRTRSILCVPLRVRETTIGAIEVVNDRRAIAFSAEDLNLLRAIASQAAIAIENARLHEAARRHARQLSTLNALTRTLTTTLDPTRVTQEIVSTIRELLPGVAVRLWGRVPERGEELAFVASDGLRNAAEGGRLRIRVGEGLIGQVAATRQMALSPDIRQDPRFQNRDWAEREGLSSTVMLPLVLGEQLHGVLAISTRAPHVFTEEEQDLLRAFAAQAAIAMENARLFAELNDSYLRLQQAQDELIRAEKLRALGQMAAGIAHDLNNMLAAVLGQAELLRLRATDPPIREALQKLETAAADGAQVVRRLQDFARQRPSRPLAPCDLGQMVDEALELTRPRWQDEPQRRGIVIEVRKALDNPPPILGHAAEIREALMNIILNAVDAMPQGGTLSFAARPVFGGEEQADPAAAAGQAIARSPLDQSAICNLQSALPEWVELSISDTGMGMSEEVRRRMFDPFFTTKGLAGTGLGLSVTYGIMERHGGQIRVASVLAEGTTLTLRFQGARSGAGPAVTAPPSPARPCRILIVDDDPAVREALVGLLEASGHQVVEADRGSAGLARLAEGPVDLVITDLGMPGMSGWEVARAVKAAHPTLPVVLLTGWGEQPAGEDEAGHLVDRVLAKPIPLEALQAVIAELTRMAP